MPSGGWDLLFGGGPIPGAPLSMDDARKIIGFPPSVEWTPPLDGGRNVRVLLGALAVQRIVEGS